MPALVLPEIGALVAAVLLMILAAALWLLRRTLVQALSHLPVVGHWVGRELGGWIDDARDAIVHAEEDLFHAAAHLFETVDRYVWHFFGAIGGLAYEAAHTMWHVITVTVPATARAAEAYALKEAGAVRSVVVNLYHQAIAYADHQARAVEGKARAWYEDAIRAAGVSEAAAKDLARSLFRAAEADITTGVAAAEAYAHRLMTAAVAAASSLVAAAEAKAVALFHQAEADLTAGDQAVAASAQAALSAATSGLYTDLATWGDKAVADVWPQAQRDIEALRRTLGGDFGDIKSLLDALGGAGAAGLAGALTMGVAGAATAVRALDDCVIPNCRNLSSLGKDLSQLSSLAATAAEVGWLAYCVADPTQAADDTAAVGMPVAQATLGAAEHLFGVG